MSGEREKREKIIVDTLFRSNAHGQRTHSAWTKIKYFAHPKIKNKSMRELF
jgi:hypothetical protein